MLTYWSREFGSSDVIIVFLYFFFFLLYVAAVRRGVRKGAYEGSTVQRTTYL